MNLDAIKHSHFDQLYSTIKVFIYLARCFNIMPYVMEKPGGVMNTEKRRYYILMVLHIVWSTFVISCVALSTHYQHTQFDTQMGFLTRVLYMGEYFLGIANMILIMYGCQYQRKRYTEYLTKLGEIDFVLVRCGCKIHFKFLRIYFKFYLILYAIFFAVVLFVDLMYNRASIPGFFRSSTVYTIPNIISIVALTQYSGIMFYIRVKYQQINKVLVRIFADQKKMGKIPGAPKRNLISIVGVAQSQTGWESSSASTINMLRTTYADLGALTKKVNESFGILIISTLIAAFVIVSIQFYAIYKTVEGFSPDDSFLTLYTILWIILHGGKVVIILLASDGVFAEKIKTGSLLYAFEDNEKYSMELRDMVRQFSMQLLHDCHLETACGIVPLNLQLIQTLVGALTTYLVILIQFDASARGTTGGVTNGTKTGDVRI